MSKKLINYELFLKILFVSLLSFTFACTFSPSTISDAITTTKIKLLKAQIEELEAQPTTTPAPIKEPAPTPPTDRANGSVGTAAPPPTPSPGESSFVPTPTPTPADTRPPLERIASVKFTKASHPIGLKVTPVFFTSSEEPIDWQWEGTVTMKYTIYSQQRNWELTTDAKASLTKDKPFFVAEGDFDSVHEVLIKEEVDMTYELILPNGKRLSGKRQAIASLQPAPSPSPSPSPTPTPETKTTP